MARHQDQPHTTTLRSTRWCICGGGGRFTIIGTVAPGYEPVRAQFERHFAEELEACHDSEEDFCRLDALLCTATAWIFIPAYCFAIP